MTDKPDKLLAFDPAVHHVAWAAFDGGRLARCELVRDKKLGAALEQRFRASSGWQPMRVLIEIPQVYEQRKWEGDPNDLIDVAVTVGRVAQAFGPEGPAAEFVRPRRWKGTAPKEVVGRWIVKRLDDAEQNVLRTAKAPVPASLHHNIVDAIGIGLWALGRLGR